MSDQHIEAAAAALENLGDWDDHLATMHVSSDERLAVTAIRAWLDSVGLTDEALEQIASWVNAVDLELEPQRYVEEHGQDVDRLGAWIEAMKAVQQ